ncbi:FecR family protein [Flavivirga sp. 57AJ16]|uniref:FecR family protein n=1 Tax=Flavivirga sp. 57AJ16 TaxID=3025307 RepID=UPI0023668D1F|nr:FecR family protein [Flavivirga sp. 57AJ16]MDD7888242.1 FecR family protein [Flavivirga sp. 57AJ16]
MLDTNQKFYTAKLIIKSVLGTLSSQEDVDFEKWLSIPGNKEFYHRILKEENFENKISLFENLDKNAAYSKILKRIDNKQQTIKRKPLVAFRSVYRYAAAAILLISVGYYGISHFSSKPTEINNSIVLDLEPGYDKATLVLEDGTEVDLEKNEFVKTQTLAEVKNQDNALVYLPNRESNSAKSPKKVGKNTLFVPRGGIYKLILPDGSKVWLNSSSSLKYPTSFEGNKRVVELSGEAYFEVKKDVGKSFIVKTKMRDISVLGTSFNVSAYNDDAFFAATLAEGKIKLVGDQQKEVYLKPGEQAVVGKKDLGTVQVKNVNPQVYSAWKDGTFFFENMSLDNILRKVGRWYNFKTDFSHAQLSEITFTGLASKEFPAKLLLDRISKSANVTYEIIQNTENNEEYLVKISRKDP